jgi:hypothetical protein
MMQRICETFVDAVADVSGSNSRRELYKGLVASILSLILSIVIVAFIGKWLWNTTVAELFTFVRPVRSAWQIIGLMIFVSLMK